MPWFFFALLSPLLYGLVNIIDNHFANHLFKKTHSLIFYTTITNLLFLPLVWWWDAPNWITTQQIPYFIILGFTGVSFLYPYYKALQHQDTSVVVSLFALGKVFVPVLAFFLVGETLQANQYLGFLIVVLAATALSLNKVKKFKLNASFLWMALCTFILAIEAVIYKYVFNFVSWGTGFVWASLATFSFAIILICFKKTRKDVLEEGHRFKKHLHLFALTECLAFGAAAAITYAISLSPVTLVTAIDSLQPAFVLLYILILQPFFPKSFKEDLSPKVLIKKGLMFMILIVGISLILA